MGGWSIAHTVQITHPKWNTTTSSEHHNIHQCLHPFSTPLLYPLGWGTSVRPLPLVCAPGGSCPGCMAGRSRACLLCVFFLELVVSTSYFGLADDNYLVLRMTDIFRVSYLSSYLYPGIFSDGHTDGHTFSFFSYTFTFQLLDNKPWGS